MDVLRVQETQWKGAKQDAQVKDIKFGTVEVETKKMV